MIQVELDHLLHLANLDRESRRKCGLIWLGCAAVQSSLWVHTSSEPNLFNIIFPVLMPALSLLAALRLYVSMRRTDRCIAHLKSLVDAVSRQQLYSLGTSH